LSGITSESDSCSAAVDAADGSNMRMARLRILRPAFRPILHRARLVFS
jgi:hypothetical protein